MVMYTIKAFFYISIEETNDFELQKNGNSNFLSARCKRAKTICKSVEVNKARLAVQVFVNDDDYLGCP